MILQFGMGIAFFDENVDVVVVVVVGWAISFCCVRDSPLAATDCKAVSIRIYIILALLQRIGKQFCYKYAAKQKRCLPSF